MICDSDVLKLQYQFAAPAIMSNTTNYHLHPVVPILFGRVEIQHLAWDKEYSYNLQMETMSKIG